ncbi:hypothetical protein [Candidatus Uabimicrobium amorphum]|uniref:Protein kinase domain-containing protein n=1 Tax=Uabimicrobium amorphum TaxID=2596890 RepID=A0A5S9IQS0_UABAM|nr:hypothetical protein [Candidatus Uabimicrobium amorphum]BBM86184.1 hypothetical protein UABAM_04570 [Candidatus Uabimicrobium amorphum]
MDNNVFRSLWSKIIEDSQNKNSSQSTYRSNTMTFSNDITVDPNKVVEETFSNSETVAPHSSNTFSEDKTILQQQNKTFSKEETIAPVLQSQINVDSKSDYQNFKEINRGGMGIIYEAQQNKLKRDVAIKKMLPGTDRASPLT